MAPWMKRDELKFQDHIIDSYALCGGYAKKWASDVTVGNPDLVCAHPSVRQHLMEIKHRPSLTEFDTKTWDNQLGTKQVVEARRHIQAGGIAFAALVIGSSDALRSKIGLFHPLDDTWDPRRARWVPYRPGNKYDISLLMMDAIKRKIGGIR